MDSPLPSGLLLVDTLGATFFGVVFCCFLSGTTSLQAISYFRDYREDKLWNKLVVAVLWILDLLHTFFIVAAGYWYFIKRYGDPAGSISLHWSIKASVWPENILIPTVQTLYAIRIWKLSKDSKVGRTCATSIILVAWGVAIYSTIGIMNMRTFYDIRKERNVFCDSIATSLCLDTVLVIMLGIYVKPWQAQFANAQTVVLALFKYSMASGAATSLCSLVGLITFFRTDSLLFIVTTWVMAKLYNTSYLALLSSRRRWKDTLAKPNMDFMDFFAEECVREPSLDSLKPLTAQDSSVPRTPIPPVSWRV